MIVAGRRSPFGAHQAYSRRVIIEVSKRNDPRLQLEEAPGILHFQEGATTPAAPNDRDVHRSIRSAHRRTLPASNVCQIIIHTAEDLYTQVQPRQKAAPAEISAGCH